MSLAPSALLQAVQSASNVSTRAAAATALADYVHATGIQTLAVDGILDSLSLYLNSKSASERESALFGYEYLFRRVGSDSGADSVLVPLLPSILDRFQEAGKTESVKNAADKAAKQLIKISPPELATKTIELLFSVIDGNYKWKSKVAALELLATFAISAKDQVAERLGEYVPRLTPAMRDTKSEVASAAYKTGIALCKVLTNPDIQPFVPTLVKCMADPSTVPETIKKLSSTVWVREIDAPTLAVVSPLLVRALGERSTVVQRQTVILVANLFKLVRSPDLAAEHAKDILPGVVRILESAAFPEIRAFAEQANEAIVQSSAGADADAADVWDVAIQDQKKIFDLLCVTFKAKAEREADAFVSEFLKSISFALAQLVRKRSYGQEEWEVTYTGNYLKAFVGEEIAKQIGSELHSEWMAIDKSRHTIVSEEDDDETGEIICDLPFSLAYGGLLLLNHTTLKLRRGQRIGVCGHNGCGKSTLLKAINRKQIENFPQDLKSAYVEHDIEGDESGITVFQLMMDEPRIQADEKEIRETLLELGFEKARQDVAINSLSGGWKMRVALCRAMLMKVDLLLLDEPTNHLDTKSVNWLQDYLNAQTNVACMIISHDSGFLDSVCTHIVHYQKKQLVYYKGNLAKFVEKNPAAKSYYTLSSSVVKFTFPSPGSLMGVRSQTRAILKMSNCTFTYPGAAKPQLTNVSCAVSLSSRVGIVGPNGAGKSTVIKLLTGETIPDSGRVEKHPNLRVAYVAQHAFHHIEEHLEKSATQYIQWRYQNGHDKEMAAKATRALTEEEKKLMEVPIVGRNGEERFLERIVGRQKQKKSYAYEIKWRNMNHKFNTQLPREKLIEHGFTKLVQEYDDLEASREGSGSREMSLKLVRKHLEDVGLDGDIAEYNEMRGLSGGQKVKVVIAAAMWSKPQVLILDEPTNFLDRDALGGLAVGIKEWTGAFLCISHNQEFVSALCSEIWNVNDGVLTQQGKVSTDDGLFESNPTTRSGTPAPATPGNMTPLTALTTPGDTPAGSADEARAEQTIEGVDQALSFKAAKGKKKMTRKQMKEREERRRLRTLAWLSSSDKGAVREPDTESDEEVDGKALRIPSKKTPAGTPPVVPGLKH